MSTAVSITNRGRGAPQYPVYKWRVDLRGETPYYADTLKEAKEWAREHCGVTEWVRSENYHHITYTPVIPPTGEGAQGEEATP